MNILLLSSAFSGLTQRFYTELDDAGYTVSVELHHGDAGQVIEGVKLFKPDLIICPFLTQKIPAKIYENYPCLIVHPGIEGDRGPSSLDWAIQNGATEWGVTLLAAQEQMDMGDIWAKRTFPMRNTTKSSLFNREVTQAAVECLWDALTFFNSLNFQPRPLNYQNPDVKGQLQAFMKQENRKIDWHKQSSDEILRHIHAADGSPGVLDEIFGIPVYLYNAHKEEKLTGKAGTIIATANHAICRATIDGAIWIGHLKAKMPKGEQSIKLPATFVLKNHLPPLTRSGSLLSNIFSKSIQHIDIDYTQEGRQLPVQEVWHQLENRVATIHSPFHNGGMSTEQCRLLLKVYQHVATLDIDVIILMGGEESWSNGIHLNHIEYADDPAQESWLNINAIDDLILQIISTTDKVTIAAINGNAGAGGAILAIAPDKVYAREGVILNPHYKNMGQLYGSEYWTYLLPKRVGKKMAETLTDTQRLPLSAKKAWHLGMIDNVLDKDHTIFASQIKHLANTFVNDKNLLQQTLKEKAATRCFDEANKALASYRQYELTQMYVNFYGNDDYHQARKNFVYKVKDNSTPDNIAIHRQQQDTNNKVAVKNPSNIIWQQHIELDNVEMDEQHKQVFEYIEKLTSSETPEQRQENYQSLYQFVEHHFINEEDDMKKNQYPGYLEHKKQHASMLNQLCALSLKINDHHSFQNQVQHLFRQWCNHILEDDRPFDTYLKQHLDAVIEQRQQRLDLSINSA